MSVLSNLQAFQTVLDPYKSYWKVVLTTGKELTENKLVLDFARGGYRPIDWALDLNTTGDLLKIKELWLICPNGEQRMLSITEPGTAFQFKYRSRDILSSTIEAQCIGRVIDKENGFCECWIWDKVLGIVKYDSNINDFGMWRDGLMPLTKLSTEVMGLRLG